MLATGGTDAGISLIETDECICLHTLSGLDNVVSLLSFSSDSQWIAFSEEGSSEICIASVETGDKSKIAIPSILILTIHT